MPTYEQLVANASANKRRLDAADRPRLAVCIDTSSIAVGALDTLAALREAVSAAGVDAAVDQTGGNGMSFANPVVELTRPDGTRVYFQHVRAEEASQFVQTVLAQGELANRWTLGATSGSPEGVPSMDTYDWWSIQSRRLMTEMGVCDPENIDDYLARGAYAGLNRALGLSQEEVIAEVVTAKVGGRGGSFFPVGRKWDFLRTSPTSPKNMVCNADEGDGGAWVNRMTLENDPHSLIEGITIGGYAAGAQKGYIYIREEYPLAFERMVKAVEQARERGILGDSVLGSNFAFDIRVVRGAGSYVCGEESGLIASIEDSRGMPKIRPPFPAASGVLGEGSNVNNVESYHTAAWVLRHGVPAYTEVGTERNPGTMMFTLSGDVQRMGCFELPMGTTVRQAYEICAGGSPEGRRFKALQPGGPLLGIMPAFSLDLGMEPENFREKGMGSLGGGGLVFLDDSSCIVDLCSQYELFLEDESCGRCTTCHGGTQRAVEIIRRIQRGGGRESDIGKIRLLSATLRYSNCFHGQFATTIIANSLDWFADEVNEHIYQRRCRAHVCEGLIAYEVDEAAAALPENADAVARARSACAQVFGSEDIANFLGRDIAPSVVRIVDRFPPNVGPAPELISVQPAER